MPGFPLLAKELTELAARRRTYVIRVLYAGVLFVAALVMFGRVLASGADNPLAVLGHGGRMFEQLVWLQFVGIYLFMPALASGVITQEKERNSLGTLFLTRLGPWTIIFEKLLGRLVPMFTFLLLALPLMAFTYTLGGVTQTRFWGSIWLLMLTAIQLGAVSVMCSAYCRTSIAAFVSAYFFGLLFLTCLYPFQGNYVLDAWTEPDLISLIFATIFWQGVVTGGALILAKTFLVERAFLEPRNHLLNAFRELDRVFTDMNQITGGVVLVRDGHELPDSDPILWRETQKKSLGTARYLFRVLSAIEVPLLGVLVLTAPIFSGQSTSATRLLVTVWVLAILVVAVKATSVVSSERTSQTLSVLLTAPLSGREIVHQKFSGVRRLTGVLFIPFLTIFGFVAWWEWSLGWREPGRTLLYLAGSALSVLVYLPLVGWLAFWIGLKVRSQGRAIIVALGTVFAYIFVPLFLYPSLRDAFAAGAATYGPSYGFSPPSASAFFDAFLVAVSPSFFVVQNELRQADTGPMLVNIALYAGLLFLLRRHCLKQADRLLDRAGSRRS